MNQNSMAIIILCSHLCVGESVKPFEPAEWAKLADRLVNNGIQPYEILSFTDKDFESRLNCSAVEIHRFNRLIERSGSLAFEIERYANMGINIMTRADNFFPKPLKRKLAKNCPPLFYYIGRPELADMKFAGFVGSRNVKPDDGNFTVAAVAKINAKGLAVVSGGAKGIDAIASAASIENGSYCVEYIADSLINKIKHKNVINAVINNRLLILSVAKPDSGFTTGIAMMRNKYIYAQSDGTVVVKADYNKGGTWSGALSNLDKQWCVTFCWNNAEYQGNTELINRGAIPIDDTWDGDIYKYEVCKKESHEQLSLFNI